MAVVKPSEWMLSSGFDGRTTTMMGIAGHGAGGGGVLSLSSSSSLCSSADRKGQGGVDGGGRESPPPPPLRRNRPKKDSTSPSTSASTLDEKTKAIPAAEVREWGVVKVVAKAAVAKAAVSTKVLTYRDRGAIDTRAAR